MELCEYHGGAQRGGIRIPEGFRGKHWDRFVKELHLFFPDMALPTEHHAGKSRNGKEEPNMEKRDPCAGLKPAVLESDILKSIDTRDSSKPSEGYSNADLPCVRLDPNAPRPTRLHEFKWQPLSKTLRITKEVDGKRRAEWVGLRTKAFGLAQEVTRAVTQAQALANGSVHKEQDQAMADPIPEPSLIVNEPVEHVDDGDSCSLDDEIQADDIDPPSETPEMAIVCMDTSSPSSVWVDLASMESDGLIGLYPELHDGIFETGETSQSLLESATEEVEEPMPILPITLAEELIGEDSPLRCEPLAMIGSTGHEHGAYVESSVWVKQRHQGFCKLVGFPIESHEQECLALLQRIEADRFLHKEKGGARRQPPSGTKGARELRRLVSTVNYDGRHPVC